MTDIVVGILAVLAGGIFCFRGQHVMRIVIPIWGAFAGFAFGAGLVAGFADERFVGTVLGWVLGFVFALLFALLAYAYYWFAIVLATGAAGFALGSGIVVALGIDWSWVAALVGLAVGLLIGILAVLLDLPLVLLSVFSALGGAVAVVVGLMLVVGAVDTADFSDRAFTDVIEDDWWWYALYLGLALAGMVAQSVDRARSRLRLAEAIEAEWARPTPASR